MEQFNPVKEPLAQWIIMEHYRLHCVEAWADSSQKEALLEGIHSALDALTASMAPLEPPKCIVCASRNVQAVVLEFPSKSQGSSGIKRLAA